MKILFTGSSSFTGCWFIRALAEQGHTIHAIFRQPKHFYSGIRAKRLQLIEPIAQLHFSTDIESSEFSFLLTQSWDVWCHHAAEVSNYRSPQFDIAQALHKNTAFLPPLLSPIKDFCGAVALTGSIFEPREGGEEAVSPYGVSKAITWDVFAYYMKRIGVPLGKFVIPNPFGPLEEDRFTGYLIRSWLAGESPVVRTPDYIRDNIHVSLLAKYYVRFIENLSQKKTEKMSPSGYQESQKEFTARMAKELAPRLGCECAFSCLEQKEYSEPLIRLNTGVSESISWDESSAWDELASFYLGKEK